MAAIRSLSFTRSSRAPVSSVSPRAQAAATKSAGNSSMAEGTTAGGIATPSSSAPLTRRSAIGSPPASRSLYTSMAAPMLRSTWITPSRVGFIPTPSMRRSEPAAMLAPTRKKAAEEMSPGTRMSVARSRPPPVTATNPSPRSTGQPKAASMRSV